MSKDGEMKKIQPLCYRGTVEISNAVGINHKNFRHFVKCKGLPAFRIEGKGNYIALAEDLEKWLKSERDKHLSSSF